jgi:hypothetical protein
MMPVPPPDLATLSASLLPALERNVDPSNLAQMEAIALLRRAAKLFERGRVLTAEQLAISVELEAITERLERLAAGAAVAPAGRQ